MPERSSDWFRQGEYDLSHAKKSLEFGDYEWACFAAHQAVEKVLKAVYQKNNRSVRGHSIVGLLQGLEDLFDIPGLFPSYARILSRYYIETRYPNGFPEGAPKDYFDEKIAQEALDAAEEIFEWCRDTIG